MKNTYKLCIFIALALMTGCVSTPQKADAPKIFFPEPPDPPRIQFLTYFTGESDIAKKKSAFETFVTGAQDSRQRLDKPYGAAIRDGKVYVSDVNQGIIIFDFKNKTYGRLQGDQGLGKLLQPVNIRIDSDGTKYVSDPIRGQVVVYDKNDFFVTAFGSSDLWRPVDAVVYEDLLYVADMKNSQIAVLDKKSGQTVRKIGQMGEPAERISRPTNLAFDDKGYLFISDAGRFQVVKMDRDGHFLGAVGQLGSDSGTFARPRGIALDRENRLYVVDAAFGNVQMFNKDGHLLMPFGTTGPWPSAMYLPAQIIIDYDNIPYFQQYADPNFVIEHLMIVTNQFGDKMINVYAFGKDRGKSYPTDAELLEQLKAKLEKAAKEKAAKENTPGSTEEPEGEKK